VPSANAARLARFMLGSRFRAKRERRTLGTVHAEEQVPCQARTPHAWHGSC